MREEHVFFRRKMDIERPLRDLGILNDVRHCCRSVSVRVEEPGGARENSSPGALPTDVMSVLGGRCHIWTLLKNDGSLQICKLPSSWWYGVTISGVCRHRGRFGSG